MAKKLTAEKVLSDALDLEALNEFIDKATDQYKDDLKKGLTDLALKQIDERIVKVSNQVVEALLKWADQDEIGEYHLYLDD